MVTEILVPDLVFPEALRVQDGRLWFVDMYDGKLMSVGIGDTGPGDLKCHHASESDLGGVVLPAGAPPLVVDKPARQILRIGAGGGADLFADLTRLGSSRLNEMILLPGGDLVVGEYGFDLRRESPRPGNLYRVDGQGRANTFFEELAFPNGMVLSADHRSLFVAETMGQRITRLTLSGDGQSVVSRRPLIEFEKGGPDGLAVDEEDRIWAAMIGQPSLVRITHDGRIDRQIPMDVPIYDVALDPGGARLFAASSRARMSDLRAAPLPRSGAILVIYL